MRNAKLAGAMALPVERINVKQHTDALTIEYLPMGADEAEVIHAYRKTKDYLYVPRQYGLEFCDANGIDYDDETSPGHPVTFPRTPEPRDYQVGPLDRIAACFDSHYDFLFRARTGWGKTIGGLIAAARRGVTTIVVVDQEKLKNQWIKALKEHFGLDDSNIGIVQGKVCKYKGCPVTIAMVQSLTRKAYPEEFYAHFGLLIVDEVHTVGAPTFSQILTQFPASYRFGVSATPKRRDGLQRLLDWNLGKPRIWVSDEHDVSSVYVVESDTIYSWYANFDKKIGRFINEIAEDGARNYLLAEAIGMLYDSGRDVLVLSDRIEHLKHTMNLCYYLGIPEDDMGLYAGYNPSLRYAKEPTPKRRVPGADRKAQYTPIVLQSISKRLNTKALDAVEKRARIIFGTYGMFSKGTDIPRLTGGVDLTPRSEAEQVHGRILRQMEGALKPVWVTTNDINSFRSSFGLANRINGYLKNNARIFKWQQDEDAIRVDAKGLQAELYARVKELKSMRLEQNSDGLNTLLTKQEQMRSDRQRATEAVSSAAARSRQAGSRGASSQKAYPGRSSVTRSTPPSRSLPTPSRKPLRRSARG